MNLSPIANLIVQGAYYILVGLMAFFGAFGVYVLMRYGEKQLLSLIVSLLFSLFFLVILTRSYAALQNII